METVRPKGATPRKHISPLFPGSRGPFLAFTNVDPAEGSLTHTSYCAAVKRVSVKMYQIGNIYGITAIAVIGGGLFGFDISSMSAMYVHRNTTGEGQC